VRGERLRLRGREAGQKAAKRIKDDGYTFGSKAEHARYLVLKLMRAAGEIEQLTIHPRYALFAPTPTQADVVLIGHMILDFTYYERGQGWVREDWKSYASRTPLYYWKKRHLERQEGIVVTESGT
jgi:hypothetical protein